LLRHANAAMRGGTAGQLTAVYRQPTPAQPQHERHRRIVVEIRAVKPLLLKDGIGADRRFVSALAGGNRRHADQYVALIDAGTLRLERYDDQKRLAVGGGVIGPLELSGPEGHFLDNA